MRAPRLIRLVQDQLARAGCVAADDEAEEMVSLAPDRATLSSWVERRRRGEPLAWIVGTMSFCGHRVVVDRGVYVPRHQTEHLARTAAALLPARGHAADLCCGCGAVAVHLQATRPGAVVVGADIDGRATACARRNGVRVVTADLAGGLRSAGFDVVTAVAPYVPTPDLRFLPADVIRYEPLRALDGGPDGMGVLRGVVDGAARLLRPGGWLVIELGGRQEQGLRGHLADAGFGAGQAWHDEDGDLRGLAAIYRGGS